MLGSLQSVTVVPQFKKSNKKLHPNWIKESSRRAIALAPLKRQSLGKEDLYYHINIGEIVLKKDWGQYCKAQKIFCWNLRDPDLIFIIWLDIIYTIIKITAELIEDNIYVFIAS